MAEENLPAPAQRPEIVDQNNVPVVFVDWIITGGMHDGVVNITLGTIDHAILGASDGLARIVIGARLRFSRGFAVRLHKVLGDFLEPSAAPSEPQQPPPSLPKNMIN